MDGRCRQPWHGRVAVCDRRQRHLYTQCRLHRHGQFHLHGGRQSRRLRHRHDHRGGAERRHAVGDVDAVRGLDRRGRHGDGDGDGRPGARRAVHGRGGGVVRRRRALGVRGRRDHPDLRSGPGVVDRFGAGARGGQRRRRRRRRGRTDRHHQPHGGGGAATGHPDGGGRRPADGGPGEPARTTSTSPGTPRRSR